MTKRANHKIAEDFLAAYKDRDFERIEQLLHKDIEWTLPGNGTISGVAAGPDVTSQKPRVLVLQDCWTVCSVGSMCPITEARGGN